MRREKRRRTKLREKVGERVRVVQILLSLRRQAQQLRSSFNSGVTTHWCASSAKTLRSARNIRCESRQADLRVSTSILAKAEPGCFRMVTITLSALDSCCPLNQHSKLTNHEIIPPPGRQVPSARASGLSQSKSVELSQSCHCPPSANEYRTVP